MQPRVPAGWLVSGDDGRVEFNTIRAVYSLSLTDLVERVQPNERFDVARGLFLCLKFWVEHPIGGPRLALSNLDMEIAGLLGIPQDSAILVNLPDFDYVAETDNENPFECYGPPPHNPPRVVTCFLHRGKCSVATCIYRTLFSPASRDVFRLLNARLRGLFGPRITRLVNAVAQQERAAAFGASLAWESERWVGNQARTTCRREEERSTTKLPGTGRPLLDLEAPVATLLDHEAPVATLLDNEALVNTLLDNEALVNTLLDNEAPVNREPVNPQAGGRGGRRGGRRGGGRGHQGFVDLEGIVAALEGLATAVHAVGTAISVIANEVGEVAAALLDQEHVF